MTEKEFWRFLENAWVKGREAQFSVTRDSADSQLQKPGEYIGGHSLLPKNYGKIPKSKIIGMGQLLLDKRVKTSTKEGILIILAHHPSKEALNTLKRYNENPDKDLDIFAKFALEECEMWNE